jgi:lipopolysaccharide transport system ATP-binding protein
MAAAIEFDHVGKQYRLGLVTTKTLSHDLDRWWKTAVLKKEDPYLKIGETNDRSTFGNSEYVWALKDIDFKIEQGDVVGIIGKNGAGKSTLLKLLSKVTGPTVGTIRARGRIGSLLEVGTGFHSEMTGRENIYMNGAILGMTKADIARRLDDIISFSGCERYIDTPVKRYSSGMTVRLGFAVAAFMEPEILVVDEVLAVGDAEFQKKAIGKRQDVSSGEGRTVLFVSHNMTSIRALCKTGVLLENGMTKSIGQVNDIVSQYLLDNAIQIGDVQKVVKENMHIYRPYNYDGATHQLEIVEIERLTPYKIDSKNCPEFRIRVKRTEPAIKKIQLVTLVDDLKSQQRVGLTCSDEIWIADQPEEFELNVRLNHLNLTRGIYMMNFWVGFGDIHSNLTIYDAVYNSLTFEVTTVNDRVVTMWSKDWGFNYYSDCETELVK